MSAADNAELLKRIQSAQGRLQTLYGAGDRLTSPDHPHQMLQEVVELVRVAATAAWVCMILIDESGRAPTLIWSGIKPPTEAEAITRPDGVSADVMRSGVAEVIEEADDRREHLDPPVLRDDTPSLLCLPLALQAQRLGVIWIGYDVPRSFDRLEVEALQLYVNQAAIAYDSLRRVEELNLIQRAAGDLAASADTRDILAQVVERARTIFAAHSAVILSYEPERDAFTSDSYEAAPDSPRTDPGDWRAAGGRIAYAVMNRGWLTVSDVEDAGARSFLGESELGLLRRAGVRSFIGVALTVGGEALGSLLINYDRPHSFSESERRTAATLATHAGLALKKAKLREQVVLAQKAAEAAARVMVVGDRERTLRAIVEEVRNTLNCDAVTLYEYDPAARTFRYPPPTLGVFYAESVLELGEVPRDSVVHRMMARESPEIVERVHDHPLLKDSRFARSEGIESCVVIPLRAGQDKVGVLFVNYRQFHRFSRDELDNLMLFADQAGVAISNAQLFDRQMKRLNEQESLIELSKTLLKEVTAQETLDSAVRFASEALAAELCALVLYDEDGRPEFSAALGWPPELAERLKAAPASNSHVGYTLKLRAPVAVSDYQTETRMTAPEGTLEYGVRSGLSVPLFDGEAAVGALLVQTRSPRYYSSDEVNLLSLIANLTSIALQSARQYEANLRRGGRLKALYESAKAITASFGLGLELVLHQIMKQAAEGVMTRGGRGPVRGTLHLYDEERRELVLASVYPPEQRAELAGKMGERVALDEHWTGGLRQNIGMRAVLTREPQLVHDVRLDPHYVMYSPSTLSEMSVPLVNNEGKLVGVINVESDQVGGFDREDLSNLEALADMAVMAVENTRQYQELRRTRGLVGARTALAWMGMASSIWRHSIEGYAINIRNLLTLLRSDVESWGLDEEKRQQLEKRLQFIERQASKILEKGMPRQLSADGADEVVQIDELIRERINQLWVNEPYKSVACELDLAAGVSVRVSPDWFRRALDILVDNAVEAMARCDVRKLKVSTRRTQASVEVAVSDTGGGIPAEVREHLFKNRIVKSSGEKGFGVGLLIAQTIVESFGGSIRVGESGESGTTFIISLPSQD